MEDVVLHYKPGPGQNLPALIETTERLLAPFPRRPPQVFSPWFPSIVDRHLPLRPARPPPRILSAPGPTTAAPRRDRPGPKETREQDQTGAKESTDQDRPGPEGTPEQRSGSQSRGWTQGCVNSENDGELSHGLNGQEPNRTSALSADRGVPFVPETPPDPGLQGLQDLEPGVQIQKPGLQIQEPGLQIQKTGLQILEPGLQIQEPGLQIQNPGLQVRSKPASPSKRCWTVFSHCTQTKGRTKGQTRVQTRVQAVSRRFQQTVSKLRLQGRQRVKWIIDTNNCTDIEQVWSLLSRPPLGFSLPSCCNAHIDRGLDQVWVYCDLLQSEQVGLSLKQGLKLRGRISLWERRLGSFYRL